MPKPLTVVHGKLWTSFEEMGVPDYVTYLVRNLYAGQKAAVRAGRGTTDFFQIVPLVPAIKVVYCHPAYLTYMQSTSCEMPGWMKHKLESRFLGEIPITSDMQMTLSLWQKANRS